MALTRSLARCQLFAFLVSAAVAGPYIGFGDIVMLTAESHADPEWAHLIMDVVFSSA